MSTNFNLNNTNIAVGLVNSPPTGTAWIVMRTNKYYTDATLLRGGVAYLVDANWANIAVQRGFAQYIASSFNNAAITNNDPAPQTVFDFAKSYSISASLEPEANGWRILKYLLYYLDRMKAGFDTYAPDNTYTIGSPAATLYFDSLNGSDSNSGATYLLPKKTFPTTFATNTKYFIAAGSVYYFDFRNVGHAAPVTNNGVQFAVYDRNGGGEIFRQPNPYERARLGQQITDTEKNTLYFQIIGNAGDIPPYAGTAGAGFRTSGTGFILRGAWVENTSAGIYSNGGETVEDCVFYKSCRNSSWLTDNGVTDNYGGVGINVVAGSPAVRYARFFVDKPGEDALWLGASGLFPANSSFTDFAIRHWTSKQVNNNQHADIMQGGWNSGTTVFQRGICEHIVQESVTAGSGNSRSPIGAGFQWGTTAGTATGTQLNQVAIISNHNCFNMGTIQTGMSMDRFAAVVLRHGVYFDPNNPATINQCNPLQLANTAITQTNCLAAFINPYFKNVVNGDNLFGPDSIAATQITQSAWEQHLG